MIAAEYGKVHFIGIGGISLSSLAKFLMMNGVAVSGSDRAYSNKLIELAELGCSVHIGSDVNKINSPDLAVYSGAIPETDEELVFCRSHGIPCIERNEFLGALCEEFDCCIAVAGTHGKTTVTSMLTKIFADAGLSFYGHIGGETTEFGNCYFSGYDCLLTEACEYRKSFLSLNPKIGIILNAEADHPDTYSTLKDVYDAFDSFAEKTKKNSGLVIVNGDSEFYRVNPIPDAVTFGISEKNRFRATDIYEYKKGYKGFLVTDYGNPIGLVRLPIPGEHNIYNALCAFVTAYIYGVPSNDISKSLNSFSGVKRRFEYVCKYRGSDVYTDYAHHPSEIRATLLTAKSLADKITVIFQPHTYSRTAELFDEFIDCFSLSDRVIIVKEYPAREVPSDGKSAFELFQSLPSKEKYYCENIIDAISLLNKKTTPTDTVLVLGAGDIVNICDIMKNQMPPL